MRRPFLWFLISLITGIVCGRYILGITAATVIIIIAVSAVFFVYKNKIKEPLFMPLIAIIGFMLCTEALSPKDRIAESMVGKDVEVYAVVREKHITNNDNVSMTADVKNILCKGINFGKGLKINIISEKIDIDAGDIIKAKGKYHNFEEPSNPYQNDYKIYAKSKSLDYRMWTENIELTGNKDKSLIYKIENCREKVNAFFDDNMPHKEASIAKALTTGYKYDIDEETKDLYKNMGISHVLAVSGLHVTIITSFIIFLFTRILKIRKRIILIPVSFILIAYLIFTGISPSAIRAVVMTIVAFTALLLYKNSDNFNTIAFSAFIMLLINPLYLWNISFQLSYLGITGCALGSEIVKNKRHSRKITKSVLFATVVWVFTTPLVMYYFGGVSLISILSNIFAVPYLSIITGISLLSGALCFCPVGSMLSRLVYMLLILYENAAECITSDAFYISCARPGSLSLIIVYTFIIICIVYRNKKCVMKLSSCLFTVSVITLLILRVNSPSEIVFFDAGQGDCSAIYVPGEVTVVIDGGPEGKAENSVIPYLKAKGVRADILFITHMDEDHSSGAIKLMESNMVETVVISDTKHKDKVDEIYKIANEKNITIFRAGEGDRIICGDLNIECFYPNESIYDKENNTSLVFKAEVNGISVLFTGDIEIEDEKYLINNDLKADIIKVPHHGSDTSSSEEFIEYIDADIAVIEAGRNNIYGLPDNEVIERFENNGCDIYVTGRDGAITIYCNNEDMDITAFNKNN